MRRVCVFCGSKAGNRPAFVEAAERLAESMVRRGLELVYGGSKMGLMGALADAVVRHGGQVTGVIPRLLMSKEVVHPGLTQLLIVSSMHERKAKMAELADAFISLPGGLGTWEETLEILTWRQLGIHHKPCGLLNVEGFFTPIVELFEHGRAQGFLRGEPEGLLLVDHEPESLLARVVSSAPPAVEPWLTLKQA